MSTVNSRETHIKKREVKQINHYYPFGLTMNGAVNAADPTAYQLTQMKNNLKYNAGSELQELSGLYDTYYRQYDAAIGRFNAIDVKATSFPSMTPYNFAFNDPVLLNDPLGDCPTCTDEDGVPWYLKARDAGGGRGHGTPVEGNGLGGRYWNGVSTTTYGNTINYNYRAGLSYNHQFRFEVQQSNIEKYENGEITADELIAKNDEGVNDGIRIYLNGSFRFNIRNVNGEWWGRTGEFVAGYMPVSKSPIVRGIYEKMDIRPTITGGQNQDGFLSFLGNSAYVEMNFEGSVGPQLNLMATPEGVYPLPYFKGGGVGVHLNIGSASLAKVHLDSRNGFNSNVILDKFYINQGIGIAYGIGSVDYKQVIDVDYGIYMQQSLSATFFSGLIGVEYDFVSKEWFFGAAPGSNWTFILGGSADLKGGIKFK